MSPGLVADVAFDLPLDRAFRYLVPPGLAVAPGQRVRAPLQGRARVGVVTDVREADTAGLQAIGEAVEPAAVLSAAMIEVGRWAAAESLSSTGSTIAALLPPPPRRGGAAPVAPPAEVAARTPIPPELWMDAAREDRLAEALSREPGSVLLIAPDVDAARRWADRLDAPRLDSGVSEDARRAAWFGASRGRLRLVVGTRSALLVPLPPPATVVLLDEHDAAHKPPGAPRIHSRDLLRQRAAIEGSRLLLLSATPSAESWRQAEIGLVRPREAPPAPWPEVVVADTRGILRHHPLTLPLTRAIEDAARRGRRVALIVSREAAALGCDECGALLRCPDCGVALAHARVARSLACRLCARVEPAPERCPSCGGHRLAAVGWGTERVEASLRRRFPRLVVARAGPPGAGRAPAEAATVVIGTPALLRTLPAGSLGCAAFVALDGLLRIPDFRAGERVFQSLWAAAEAVAPDGRLVVQTLHPDHYAVRAVQAQDRRVFYADELRFREELGYPPFRRLCVVSVTGPDGPAVRALAEECRSRLVGLPGVEVYPAALRGGGGARRARWSIAIKGGADLPRLLGEPLRPFRERRRRGGGVVEVEMDPV